MKGRQGAVRLTDCTLTDGNALRLGGALPEEDFVQIAKALAESGIAVVECFGPLVFRAQLENGVDPWHCLSRLKREVKGAELQAVAAGSGLVQSAPVADDVAELFVEHVAKFVDLFCIHDPLNDLRNVEFVAAAVKSRGRKLRVGLLYEPGYEAEYFASLARDAVAMEADELMLIDASGRLEAAAAKKVVSSVRSAAGLPVGLDSSCAAGLAARSYEAAVEAGAAFLGTVLSPVAGGYSLPATEGIAGVLHGRLRSQLNVDALTPALQALATHVERDDRTTAPPEVAEARRYDIAPRLVAALRQELAKHEEQARLQDAVAEAKRVKADLGDPPSSAFLIRLVAEQAVLNLLGGQRYRDLTQQLKEYLQGLYGRAAKSVDPALRRQLLGHDEPISVRAADLMAPQLPAARTELKRLGAEPTRENLLNWSFEPSLTLHLLSPQTPEKETPVEPEAEESAAQQEAAQGTEEGSRQRAPASSPGSSGVSEFDVEVEGEVFRVRVKAAGSSNPVPAAPAARAPTPAAEVTGTPVVAPMQGLIVKINVSEGQDVNLGDVVAVLEAMKMQNDIISTVAGKVVGIHARQGEVVTPNQPLLSIA